MPRKTLCVYTASSDVLDTDYIEAAAELGTLMAREGYALVYGGGNIGLMGVLARAVHEAGGHVTGVIPDKLRARELAYEDADELIITQTMRERKLIMEERAEAFVALPGGFGTLEEILEILVLKQLGYHQKPLIFLNTRQVYAKLFAFFDTLIAERFVKPDQRRLFHIVQTSGEIFPYLKQYEQTAPAGEKWF